MSHRELKPQQDLPYFAVRRSDMQNSDWKLLYQPGRLSYRRLYRAHQCLYSTPIPDLEANPPSPDGIPSRSADALMQSLIIIQAYVGLTFRNPAFQNLALFSLSNKRFLCTDEFLRRTFRVALWVLRCHSWAQGERVWWYMDSHCVTAVAILLGITRDLALTGRLHVVTDDEWGTLVRALKSALLKIAHTSTQDHTQAFYIGLADILQEIAQTYAGIDWQITLGDQLPEAYWMDVIDRLWRAIPPIASPEPPPLAVIATVLQRIEHTEARVLRDRLESHRHLLSAAHHAVHFSIRPPSDDEVENFLQVHAIYQILRFFATITRGRATQNEDLCRLVQFGLVQTLVRLTATPLIQEDKIGRIVKDILHRLYYHVMTSDVSAKKIGKALQRITDAEYCDADSTWLLEWIFFVKTVRSRRISSLKCSICHLERNDNQRGVQLLACSKCHATICTSEQCAHSWAALHGADCRRTLPSPAQFEALWNRIGEMRACDQPFARYVYLNSDGP
ncbi:hypothetical protein CYLTODRAFT_415875 [Cylindrobasidium torrendii FP15055 ss-10]|uniref:Uncharacterized protein n=1 Tax=Cylindrobasidium torrendii FP15055 ss-10 TaxID=1314674 RepID=A0A0D7AR44_9AGAR|nr:hypothetical protein CYLTODRAFT_415875 [Cylindrobasidium torrendii FP15055 ss-10]